MNKKFFIFTFSRSDYSSIKPILKELNNKKIKPYSLVVGGSHLSKKYGHTIDEIRKDKFVIDYKINFLKEKLIDNQHKFSSEFSNLFFLFTNFLKRKNVKKILLIGDRWELTPLAISAFNLNIEIIHHSGGDYTYGSKDNFYRSIVSIVSNIHLVGNALHKKRLELIGKNKSNIFIVGEPSLNNFKKKYIKKKDIVLATLYPSDYESISYQIQISKFIKFLYKLKDQIFLTLPAAEKGTEVFIKKILKIKKKNIKVFKNLGADAYNDAMSRSKFLIGNSSSGILEASSYKIPVINIGNRQKGRLKSFNIINSGYDLASLKRAHKKISNINFLKNIKSVRNPYYQKKCIKKIVNILMKNNTNMNKFLLDDPLINFNDLL